jgi:hypothetical protein
MNNAINARHVLICRYMTEGLSPADAYAKAVLEIMAETRVGDQTTPDAELLRQAELEYLIGEEAMRDPIGRVDRLTIRRSDKGLLLQRGAQPGLFITSHEIEDLIDQGRLQLTAERKASKARTINGRRQAEGRPTFAVVAGRKVA